MSGGGGGGADPSCANYNARDAGPVFARAFHRVNSKQPQGLRKVGATFRPRRPILTGLRNFSFAKNSTARPRRPSVEQLCLDDTVTLDATSNLSPFDFNLRSIFNPFFARINNSTRLVNFLKFLS